MSSKMMHFVNRDEEIKEAELALDNLRSAEDIGLPIREYNGIGGIGKTALLLTLWEKAKEKQVGVAFIDLSTISSIDKWEFIRHIYQSLADQLWETCSYFSSNKTAPFLFNVNDGEQLRVEIRKFASLIVNERFTVFLDSVDKVSEHILEVIATELLLYFGDLGKTLFFVASRDKIRWGSISNYRIARRTKFCTLGLFNIETVKKQLSGTNYNTFANLIMSVTNGHPESTSLVAQILQDIERLENITIKDNNFGDFEKRLINAVLDNVKHDYIVPLEQFNSFYVLSVLRFVEVTIPPIFLEEIDSEGKWDNEIAVVELLKKMQSSNLMNWQHERRYYKIHEFIRKLFSLHIRVFFKERYLVLTRAALKYYQDQLRGDPSNADLIIEKLFHYTNLLRIIETSNFDLQIAMKLRNELLTDLKRAVPGGGIAVQTGRRESLTQSFEHRRSTLEAIKQKLIEDNELHERIGDLGTPEPNRFLLEVVNDFEREFLAADHATLDIVRAHRNYHLKDKEEYTVAFISKKPEPITSRPLEITTQQREFVLDKLKSYLSVSDIKTLGEWMFSKFLRDEVRNIVSEHINLRSPLTISVDDATLPWELMHDAEDFVALRVALGKRLRTAEPSRLSWTNATESKKTKVLIVGVPDTSVEGFSHLSHVEEEVEALRLLFQDRSEIDFNPGLDILYGSEASSFAFETILMSGRYNIIHFAGHAFYEDTVQPSSIKAGLIMHDQRMELDDIKSMTKGRPFLFLNACQSAVGSSVATNTGYIGSYTLGIASAFILSGAVACIGNIWPIVDKKGSEFALEFYKKLLSGKNLGEALRLTKEFYRLRHPVEDNPDDTTWISYILYGDPTQKVITGSDR